MQEQKGSTAMDKNETAWAEYEPSVREKMEEAAIDALQEAYVHSEEADCIDWHTFVRADVVAEREACIALLQSMNDLSPLYTPEGTMDIALTYFINRLADHEEHVVKGRRHRMLDVLYVMLPEDFPMSFLSDFAQELMDTFFDEVDTFFFGTTKKGKATYLTVCCTERTFYPNGKEVPILAKGDFYRNKLTGRRCRADDENAVLVWRNGTVLRYEIHYFSQKTEIFRGPEMALKARIRRIKEFIKNRFDEYQCKKNKKTFLPRVTSEARPFLCRTALLMYNRAVSRIEASLFNCFEWIDSMGFSDSALFERCVRKLRRSLTKQSGIADVGYQKKFGYDLVFSGDLSKIRGTLDLLKRKAENMIIKIKEKITLQYLAEV